MRGRALLTLFSAVVLSLAAVRAATAAPRPKQNLIPWFARLNSLKDLDGKVPEALRRGRGTYSAHWTAGPNAKRKRDLRIEIVTGDRIGEDDVLAKQFALARIPYLTSDEKTRAASAFLDSPASRQVQVDIHGEEPIPKVLERWKAKTIEELPAELGAERSYMPGAIDLVELRQGMLFLQRGYEILPPAAPGERPRIATAGVPWRVEEPGISAAHPLVLETQGMSYVNKQSTYPTAARDLSAWIAFRDLQSVNRLTGAGIALKDAWLTGITRGPSRKRRYDRLAHGQVIALPGQVHGELRNRVLLTPLSELRPSRRFLREFYPHFAELRAAMPNRSLTALVRTLDLAAEARFRVYDYRDARGKLRPLRMHDYSSGVERRLQKLAAELFPNDPARAKRLAELLARYHRREPDLGIPENDRIRDYERETSSRARQGVMLRADELYLLSPPQNDREELRSSLLAALARYRAEYGEGGFPRGLTIRAHLIQPELARELGGVPVGEEIPLRTQFRFDARDLFRRLGGRAAAKDAATRVELGYHQLNYLLSIPMNL